MGGQPARAITAMMVPREGPTRAATRIISGRPGSASSTSTQRIATTSTHPFTSPEVAPTRNPTAVASVAATSPVTRDARAPTSSCDRTSCPASFVPSRWADDGAASDAPTTAVGSYGARTGTSAMPSATTIAAAIMRGRPALTAPPGGQAAGRRARRRGWHRARSRSAGGTRPASWGSRGSRPTRTAAGPARGRRTPTRRRPLR